MNFTNQFTHSATEKPIYEETSDGFLRCKARILRESVMPYTREELSVLPDAFKGDVVNMYVPHDAMSEAQAIRSLEGAPVVDWDHVWTTPDNANLVSKGNVAGTPIIEGDFLLCDLLITNPETISDIKNGDIGEISAAYKADAVFEEGMFDEQPYDAKQKDLRYNHIAIIPAGHGRGGADVRILNKNRKGKDMAGDVKMVRVQLRNSGKFLNMEEDSAKVFEDEMSNMEEESTTSGKKLEETMNELEVKNGELAALEGETEELKGELSVYKEKLDELLQGDAIEAAAEDMVMEQGEAEEIMENAQMLNEDGSEMKEEEKEGFTNSLKKLRGENLHKAVLSAVGVKVENMSPEALRGAFKAQNQIIKRGGNKKVVAGTKMMNAMTPEKIQNNQPVQRTAHQRLGFPAKS